MNLGFPNQETLRIALTAGIVPEAIGLAPVNASFVDGDRTWIRPAKALPKSVVRELERLGVKVARKAPTTLDRKMTCWHQLLPLAREEASLEHADGQSVLFELYRDEQLPEMVGEILRLGNDRQAFRFLENGADARALLRVIGPPYYSLLRAVERSGTDAPRAYIEQFPRVWIEVGYRHELAENIKPPPGSWLLLQPPRQWTLLPEAAFRDIYEVLDFQLPMSPFHWTDTEPDRRISIALRLAASGAGDAADFWVLHEDGMDQVEQLVRRSDDQLLDRLAFAVGESNGKTTIVLRVRPSKKPPPLLVLDGIAFRSYLKLPNLFLPIGQRLHPPLRRDAVARLLSRDGDRITWLYPNDDGTFTPESIPDSAFRPLNDWIDYVLDREYDALAAWSASHRFEFERFICADDKPDRPKAPPRRRRASSDADRDEGESAGGPARPRIKKKSKRPGTPDDDFTALLSASTGKRKPSQLQERLQELEATFLASDEPADSPQRCGVWQEMGVVNAALNLRRDSTICWCNALWEEDSLYEESASMWKQCEQRNAPDVSLGDADLKRLAKSPQTADASLFAAYLTWASLAKTPPEQLIHRLPKVSSILQRQESFMPVRAAWLAWVALSSLAGGDVLALVRARDRLLERLFQTGMRPEMDIPAFLRTDRSQDRERFRALRENVLKLHRKVNKWVVEPALGTDPQTKTYADMIFAFALARLGETHEAGKLMSAAKKTLDGHGPIHYWVYDAYEQRVRQANESAANQDRLSEQLLENLNAMDRLDRYKIDRLRNYSRILEPTERIDPYRRWHKRYSDELSQELAELFDENDREVLRNKMERLVKVISVAKRPAQDRVRILTTALELSPRLGDAFAESMLARVEQVLSGASDAVECALLLEKGLVVAAHYDKSDYVQTFVSHFDRVLPAVVSAYLTLDIKYSPENKEKIDTIDSLFSHSFRGMRKLGMRDEIGQLFGRMDQLARKELVGGKSAAAKKAANNVQFHKLLLNVAGYLFYLGQSDQAMRIVDEVREKLFRGDLPAVDQRTLTCRYTNAVGQADIETALPRIEELFLVKRGKRALAGIEDNMTTSSHFSISQLDIIETVIHTLVSDDFTLNAASRRWLDEDEFFVRRRIHRDVREAVGNAEA